MLLCRVSYKIASGNLLGNLFRNLEIYSEIWKFISKCEISLQFIQISKFRRRNFQVKDPPNFSTSGGMSGCTNVFFKRLAYLFSLKKKCRLSFSLLRSAIACLRGARSHRGCPANCGALDLALAEGQVCDHVN